MPIYELTYGYERVQFEPLPSGFGGVHHTAYVKVTYHNSSPLAPSTYITIIDNARALWQKLTRRGFIHAAASANKLKPGVACACKPDQIRP